MMNKKNQFQKVWKFIRQFVRRMTENHASAYASQSAYFIILSFIPFLILLISMMRYIPQVERFATDTIIRSVPTEAQYLVQSIIDEVYAKTASIVPFTIVVALWSAGKGFQALTNGLNVINGVTETRNYFYMRIRSILYTILFLLSIIATLLLVVFGRRIQSMLLIYWPFVAEITDFVLKFSSLITICLLALVFLLLYTYLPNKTQKIKQQLPGALVTAVLWTVFSYGFSIYFTHFSNVANMYGSLTAVMLVMLWLHICMLLFMFGAELNELLEEGEN